MSKTILVVDDSETNISAAKKFLSDLDCSVLSAKSGEEGISLLIDKEVDLILLDIEMPSLQGYEVSMLIKGNEKYKKIPLVMCSSRDTVLDQYKGRMYGADDYLCKPYTKAALKDIVQKFLTD